ncbi:hypothetical protein LWI28_017694 [Acer negundo]|uniref:TEX10-like TPR repeats domain-containing protein n=1 Tax=Acer negundo TaxID=4023 RepID=A0AAD5I6L5_ACENE|nr:hypothetical protein LWI28_017694 [Acer negundo]
MGDLTFAENIYPAIENDVKISNCGTFKSLTNAVCSCLSQMGDDSLVFQILEKVILDQLLSQPPLDNACAMLRMLVSLDSKPSRLSEQSISTLSKYLSGYLIDVVHCIPEDDDDTTESARIQTCCYYFLPCFFLFDRSHKLLKLALIMMGSLITESGDGPYFADHTLFAVFRGSQHEHRRKAQNTMGM